MLGTDWRGLIECVGVSLRVSIEDNPTSTAVRDICILFGRG